MKVYVHKKEKTISRFTGVFSESCEAIRQMHLKIGPVLVE